MKVKLVGFRKLDFTSGADSVKGMQLFVTHLDDSTTGLIADKLFIKNEDVIAIPLKDFVDKDIEVEFGFKGKVSCISAV